MKLCSHCKKNKKESEFHIYRDRRSDIVRIRLHSWCKFCTNERIRNIKRHRKYDPVYTLKYRKRNKERNREKYRGRYEWHYYRLKKECKEIIGSHSTKEWKDLEKKYKFTCLRCKKTEPHIKLVRDHIISITSLLAIDWIWNIQPLCIGCNRHKKINEDFRNI